jgi:putative tRNA adenosine deaminase-associated protein
VHSAVALRRSGSTWTAQDVELDGVETLDDLIDQLDDFDSEATEQDVTVVYVEEDDEWLGIMRVTVQTLQDPRIFLSDSRALATSGLAERLFSDALPILPPEEDEEDEEDEDASSRPDAQPVGDPELLADLATPGDVLVELCAEEGALPSDVVATLCERAGCLDALDELRGA